MQNIRDDLLAKSVKDRLEQLEKEGVIKSDRTINSDLNIEKSGRRYPLKSTFFVFILLVIFTFVVGYFTNNLKVTEFIQGSVILVVVLTLVFFVLGIIFGKLRR